MPKTYKVLHGAVGPFTQGDVLSEQHLVGVNIERLLTLGAVEESDEAPAVASDPVAVLADSAEGREQQAELRAVTVGDEDPERAERDLQLARETGDDPKAVGTDVAGKPDRKARR